MIRALAILAGAFALLLAATQPALGFQGRITGAVLNHCAPNACLTLNSESLDVNRTATVFAASAARLVLMNAKGQQTKSIEIRDFVLFLGQGLLTWQESPQGPGYLNLEDGAGI